MQNDLDFFLHGFLTSDPTVHLECVQKGMAQPPHTHEDCYDAKESKTNKQKNSRKKKKRVGRGYGAIGTLVYYWQKCKVTQSVQKTVWWLLKTIKNWITTRSCHSSSGYTPKRTESRDLERNLYTCVYSSVIASRAICESHPNIHHQSSGGTKRDIYIQQNIIQSLKGGRVSCILCHR